MKRFLLITIILLGLLVPATSIAHELVFLNFGVGVGRPLHIAPNIVFRPFLPSLIVVPVPVVVGSDPLTVDPPQVNNFWRDEGKQHDA